MANEQMQDRTGQINFIESRIVLAGLTKASIERRYNLYKGSVYDTLYKPNEAGEAAIADALGLKASELWPERYDNQTGHRLSPQPHTNYHSPPGKRQRLKQMEAQG